jgi:serpin B
MFTLLSALGLTLPTLPAASPEVDSVVAANNKFGLELYQQLRGREGNLFLSPYAINKTLAMVYAGARGETAHEMAAVLHYALGQERQHQAFLETRKLLNNAATHGRFHFSSPFKKAPPPRKDEVFLSAGLWGQRGYGFHQGYLNLLAQCYNAHLREVDFLAPEEARKTINSAVAEQTDCKVQDLFPTGAMKVTTRLALVSAIYFKGDWLHRFPAEATAPGKFRTAAGDTVDVPMMKQTEMFPYYENGKVQVLQMPYAGGNTTMIVLLPKDAAGLADLEKELTTEYLDYLLSPTVIRQQKVEVAVPKFTMASEFALRDALVGLGIRKAFAAGEADLSGMTGAAGPLFVDAVAHKSFVEVNEEGTVAAAAAGATVATLSAPARLPVFRADHPFVFVIRDVPTGMILFLGRFHAPS